MYDIEFNEIIFWRRLRLNTETVTVTVTMILCTVHSSAVSTVSREQYSGGVSSRNGGGVVVVL